MTRGTAAVLAILLLVSPVPAAEDLAPTLDVFVPGINSRGTNFLHDADAFGAERDNYRIKLEASYVRDTPIDVALRRRIQTWFDRGEDPPKTTVRSFSGPDDPALKDFLAEIASRPHARVTIDMDLVMFGSGAWSDQTDKAARIATMLAERRLQEMPSSTNRIVAHSAGTVALSRVIDAGKGSLFHHKAAASPMTWNLSPDVVIVHARGDLGSTATGNLEDVKLLGAAARSPGGWLARGNSVISVSAESFDVPPSWLYIAGRAAATAVGPRTTEFFDAAYAHSQASAIGSRDREVTVLKQIQPPAAPGEPPPPSRVDETRLSNVSSAQVLNVLGGGGGPTSPQGGNRQTNWDAFKTKLRTLEPPEGGGIALRGAAEMPFAPGSVAAARWDAASSQITVVMRDGSVWRVPPMDRELVSVAWQCLQGRTPVDPEFSIGAPLDPDVSDPAAPATWPTYFRPEPVLRGSKLGYLLYEADLALSDIAYGGTRRLEAMGLTRIEGFHSLPEMHADKYTDNPYASESERVVMETLPARLTRSGNGTLVFEERNELAIRFGRTTPVERALAELFAVRYREIVGAVPELRRLIEASHVVGVLKWLRHQQLPFEAPDAESLDRYETPANVAQRGFPDRSEITDRLPLVRYSDEGPVEVLSREGNRTRIQYKRGLVSRIERFDGATFTVTTDDLGAPLMVDAGGVRLASFSRVPDGLTIVHAGDTASAPEADPNALVQELARGFVLARDRRSEPAPSSGAALAAVPQRVASAWRPVIVGALLSVGLLLALWVRARS